MADLAQSLWEWLRSDEGQKIFRYSMVSVISTAVSFVVLLIVYGVFHPWSEVPSTVFANGVATFPSYWLNRNWAWGKTGRSHLVREVAPFWAMAAAGIAFSIVGAAVAHHIGVEYHFHHLELTAIVLFANVMSFAIFWVLKLMLFNRLFHVPSLIDEIGEPVEAEEQQGRAGVR
ncbi:MAG TPA: GtrA family protein [Acidimicrobiales bacterium]|nr:GtrA family protein [Acidimicrobiales bacterium]